MSKYIAMNYCATLITICVFLLASASVKSQVLFEEVSSSFGISHSHVSNKILGGGVAIFDYNNDGWQDIYLTGGEQPDKLLRNLQGQGFEDISSSSGVTAVTNVTTFGVTTGDVDNDGFRDIVVTTEFGHKSILMRNLGDGTFEHIPNAINDGFDWKSSASFGDVNKDGLLDLYIGAYIFQSEMIVDSAENPIGFNHECSANRLLLNTGNLSFIDVSSQYGVGDIGCSLATAFTDYDSDSNIDLMVANDFGAWVEPSVLFRNDYPNDVFENVSVSTGMDLEIYGMGIAIGDYDKDADLDYYQTNLGRNVLSRNDNGVFTDVTTIANCENDSTGTLLNTGWGTFFFDADNDSWPDLFVGNGSVEAAEFIATYPDDPNVLFLNNGDGTFSNISTTANIASIRSTRGAAYGDLDNDGKLDFVINNVDPDIDSTQYEVYRNSSASGNWVAFKLIGVTSNRDAFGSQVRIVVNGSSVVAEVGGGSSFASQNSSIVHFGLGVNTIVDSVIVTFPSGVDQVFTNVTANQQIEIIEDTPTSAIEKDVPEFKLVFVDGEPILKGHIGKPISITIHDLAGRIVVSRSMEIGDDGLSLNTLSNFSTGSYLISVQYDNYDKTYLVPMK